MIVKAAERTHVLLIRPGATDFDDQGRIKGCLDMPMSDSGRAQVSSMVEELADFQLKTIFTAPCESARETADELAMRFARAGRGEVRVKVMEAFRNVDHGLWHGKLLDELRRNNPKIYRRGEETPDTIQPPGGESIVQAKHRAMKALQKLVKRSSGRVVAIVVPDPMGELIRNMLEGNEELVNLWKYEIDHARWDLVEDV